MYVNVFVFVCEREKESERERFWGQGGSISLEVLEGRRELYL